MGSLICRSCRSCPSCPPCRCRVFPVLTDTTGPAAVADAPFWETLVENVLPPFPGPLRPWRHRSPLHHNGLELAYEQRGLPILLDVEGSGEWDHVLDSWSQSTAANNPQERQEEFFFKLYGRGIEDYPQSLGSPVYGISVGETVTDLPDGRRVYIGGSYTMNTLGRKKRRNPLNTVGVVDIKGVVKLYSYPKDVLEGVCGHCSILVGKHIYVVGGGVGLHTFPRRTPVHRLDTNTFAFESLETKGDFMPGMKTLTDGKRLSHVYSNDAHIQWSVVYIRDSPLLTNHLVFGTFKEQPRVPASGHPIITLLGQPCCLHLDTLQWMSPKEAAFEGGGLQKILDRDCPQISMLHEQITLTIFGREESIKEGVPSFFEITCDEEAYENIRGLHGY